MSKQKVATKYNVTPGGGGDLECVLEIKEKRIMGKEKKKPTTPAVPRRSPIQVLGRPDAA